MMLSACLNSPNRLIWVWTCSTATRSDGEQSNIFQVVLCSIARCVRSLRKVFDGHGDGGGEQKKWGNRKKEGGLVCY